MSQLDDLLRSMIDKAKEQFPEAGILFVAVEDSDDDERGPEITYMTNMGPEEVSDVLTVIAEPESAPEGTVFH